MAITSINLGKIKFNWRGAWTLGADYVKDDVVRYSGSSYVCITGHTSATSWATNSSKFELMAEGTTPTTTQGDIIVRGASADERLGIGNSGQVLTVEGGTPIWKDNGVNDKIYYVSPEGSDSYSGQSWGTAFATIKHACSVAVGPATVRVASGTYYEALPITVPSFVAVVGDNQRTTIVSPDSGYEQTTMWKVGDGALLNKMCFIGLTGYVPYAPDDKNIDLATIGGVYVAFDSAVPITTKSPYIIECTAKSAGGVGALLDGSLHATGTKSMVFHGYTVILDSGIGYWVSDNAKSEIVSCFTYFCHVGYAATGGGKIRALNGNNSYGTYGALASGYNLSESTLNGSLYGNQLEYTPVSLTGGSFTAGETITGSISGATGVIQNVQAGVNKLYYKIATGGPFQVGETINNGAGVTAVIATGGVTGQNGYVLVVTGLTAEPKPGGSIEFTSGDTFTYVIQSVSGWTNSSSKTVIVLAGEKVEPSLDGSNIRIRYDYSNIRLTGHDFLSIGTGGVLTTNYPGAPLQPSAQGNEVIELFPARVFYVSTDQDGNFRVGEYFKVDQATGRATLNASAFDLSGLTSLKLGSIGAQLGELVNEFSSDETLSGNSNSAVPTEKATKQYFTKVSSNVVPAADDLYTLGTPSKRWNHVYVGPGSLTIGTLTITDNAGALEIKAGSTPAPTNVDSINNGTSSVTVIEDGDVTITSGGVAGLVINSTTTTVEGNLHIQGNISADGTNTVIAATTLSVSDNMIYMNNGINAVITNAVGNGVSVVYTADNNYVIGMTVTVAEMNPSSFNVIDAVITNATDTTFTITSSVTDTFTAGGTARAKTSLNPDLGFAAGYKDGTYAHAGLFRDATDGVWKFFDGYTPEPDASVFIDTAHGSFALADVAMSALSASTGTFSDTVAINASGGITTNQTTIPLVNTTATTVNFAGAATTINAGATTGTLTLNNPTVVGSQTTVNLWNTTSTTVNAFGAATTINVGAGTGSTTFNHDINIAAGKKIKIAGSYGTDNKFLKTVSGGLEWADAAVTVSDITTNATYYPLFTTATSGTVTTASVTSTKFSFNPNSGTLSVTALTESSSIALKENINPLTNALDSILQLCGVSYDRRDGSSKNEIGLIAEDVNRIIPNLVTKSESGAPEGIQYTKLTAYLVEAIKSLKAEIDELKGNR
jgi:hypothetical protein